MILVNDINRFNPASCYRLATYCTVTNTRICNALRLLTWDVVFAGKMILFNGELVVPIAYDSSISPKKI